MSTYLETPNYNLPLPHSSNTLIEDVERIVDSLEIVDGALADQQAMIDESDFSIPAVSASGTYSLGGLVLTWNETLKDGRTRNSTFTYLGNDLCETETIVIGTRQRLITYQYDINSKLIGWTTNETTL